ncbi:acyltransferase [bacterium]|nr:acyltransferase [bacterium]
MKDRIIAACGQFPPQFGDIEGNLERICRMTEMSSADLIVFPELAISGYQFQNRDEALSLAIEIPGGREIDILQQAANDTDTHIVLGVAERSGESLFNSSLLIKPASSNIDNDDVVTIYRKLHLFDREKEIFDSGCDAPKAVDTAVGRIGMMICFDWIFPEVARVLALDGAQILCHPANLVLQYCQRAMFARSVENGVFSITCNRIGTESRLEKELTFTGSSQILGNRGEVLAQAGSDSEEIIRAEIEPALADNKMITDNNHILNDRRVEYYKMLISKDL